MEKESRIHKVYQPLNLSVTVAVSGVSLSQVVNQYEDTIDPLRSEAAPTAIRPIVYASTGAKDPSWVDGNVAAKLQEVKWLANGVDITVPGTTVYDAFHAAGSALFSIVKSSDENNGSLRLWKNLASEEQYALQMSAKFLDPRTGRFYEVLTDAVDVSAHAMEDSEWDFSVIHDVNVRYNPFHDRLRLYDWLVANGKLAASESERAKYLDSNSYEKSFNFIVTHGHSKVTPTKKITFRLLDHLHDHAEFKVGTTSWLTALDRTHLAVDLRYMGDATVVADLCMYVDGVFQSQEQLTFSRQFPKLEIKTSNASNIDMAAATRWDRLIVLADGEKVDVPDAYMRIKWLARAGEQDVWIPQGYGSSVSINQSGIGIKVGGKDKLYIHAEAQPTNGLAPTSTADAYLIGKAVTVDSVCHKVYVPLSLNVNVAESGAPTVQNEQQITRSKDNPTILTPIVYAQSASDDPTWKDCVANALLTDVTWLVDGQDISKSILVGNYSIDMTESSNRGTLRVWKNIERNSSLSLQFRATLLDSRNGNTYHILSDAVVLSCNPVAVSGWDFSVVHDVNIRYNPMIDRLNLYDWLVANGKLAASESVRAKYLDNNSYDLNLPILITSGYNQAEADKSVTFRLIEQSTGTEITTDNCIWLREFDKSHLRIDLRFMPGRVMVFNLNMYINGVFQQQEQLTFSRFYSKVDVISKNQSDIDLASPTRWDRAMFFFDGQPVEYPEAYLRIKWYARASATDEWQFQGEGERIIIRQNELNLTGDLLLRIGYDIKVGLGVIVTDNNEIVTHNGQALVDVMY